MTWQRQVLGLAPASALNLPGHGRMAALTIIEAAAGGVALILHQ